MSEVRLIDVNRMKEHVAFQKDILANMGKDMEEIGNLLVNMINEEIDLQPTVDAVPVEWIKAKIESLKSQDNEFASLSARIIQAMLNDYGADGERKTE